MSTAQLQIIGDSSNVTNFNAWGLAISNQITSAGWTKTSDTGQVNWATNPSVPGTNTWTLYEIRQPASDPLQTGATAYYVRIDYGQYASGYPTVRVTLGTGTNGAGTLTGITTSPLIVGSQFAGSLGTALQWEHDFSWDASRLGILFARNATTSDGVSFFGIERIKSSTGADSTDGVTVITCNTRTNNQYVQSIIFGASVPQTFQTWPILNPVLTGNPGTVNWNNNIAICPVFPCYGKWGNPHTIVAVAYVNDMVEGAFLATTMYGASRTYLMFKAQISLGNSVSPMMRFD